jgi:hypothetical protein
MARKRWLLCTGLLTLFMATTSVYAVDEIDPCQSTYEEIVPLRVPDFNQGAMWKRTSGIKGAERPRALLPVVDGGQIAVGASIPYDEKTGLAAPQIQMVRTDKNGKVVVEKWIPVKNLTTVADAILLKDRIVVLSQMGDKGDSSIGLSFLNGVGELKSAQSITDKQVKLIPKSIASLAGSTKMVIAAEAVSRRNPKDLYTVLIWVDKDGKKIEQKEYLPGVVNKPEYVGRLDENEIVVTGRVTAEDGRDAGWVLRLSQNGDILYQRPYARGGDSVIRRAISVGNGEMIVVGDALPAREGDKAAWVMRLNAEGNPVWQKYLTGKYSYAGVDIVKLGDGRLNVLMAGKPTTSGGRDYARVVTLSMDGVMVGDESFLEGSNSVPVRIVDQKGKRYLLGLAETGFTKAGTPDDLKYITYDTWLMGMSSLPDFKNSCAGAPARTLDDLP